MWNSLRKLQNKIIHNVEKDREVIRQLGQMVSPFTPDIALLESKKRQLIFVCDDMMQGHRNHDLIVETSLTGRWPLGHVYTLDKFHFWKKDLGDLTIPVALDEQVSGFTRHDKEPARIWGEMYAIRGYQFIKLDIEKENGVQFTRRQVKVRLPYIYSNPIPECREDYFEPWMYVGNHEYWDDQLGGIHSSQPIEKTPDNRSWLGAHYRYK